MGAAAGGARGGYKGRNSRRKASHHAMSEINVTPLVDVMLVLLIVFMVAAPLMTVGVPIHLPKTEAKQLDSDNDPLIVSIKPDGTIFLQQSQISLDELRQKIFALAQTDNTKAIHVRGDLSSVYEPIAKVLGIINGAGFQKISLETDNQASPAGKN